ncbi:MAG: YjjG family noncanonical pyrimidine nucleotidase [Oscillospiraceae bacterium]|nr:YjjG family noncanonical pyrimidine nucleotidase [Oscillospiraceae bacterium]
MPEKKWSVFLDLDNTILDFTKAERIALSQTLRERGVEPEEKVLKSYNAFNVACWEKLEEGLLTRDEVLVRRFELLFRSFGLDLDGAEANARYEQLLHIGHWFVPGAEELLRTLAPIYDLYLASNGVESVQLSRIASAGIAPYFKDIFISERMGAVKPQKAYFDACFARIPGFDPGRAIIVGDSLTSDIRGGINAGILSCWLNYNGKPGRPDIRPDYEIRELAELPPLLARLKDGNG